MDYGLTSTGFVLKTQSVIKDEWDAAMRSEFGAGFNLEPETPEGQFVGISVTREALIWEQMEAVYHGTGNPNGSTANALDHLCALTGVERLEAASSVVVLTATGTPATVLAEGRVASVEDAGDRFTTTAEATIAALNAYQNAHDYVVGTRATYGGKAWQCTIAGTSAVAGGPAGNPGDLVVDGTATWLCLGAGAGAVDVVAQSEDHGAIPAFASSLNTIETPVSGWSGAINVLDADLGRAEEKDAALRLRRRDLLRSQAAAAVDALRAAVLQVAGVTSCTIFENESSYADADGRPPKSFEALVEGGADADVAAAIWKNKPAGIATYGTTTVAVQDSQGGSRTVKFSRPVDVLAYVVVNLTKDPSLFPLNGVTIIKDALVEWADAYHKIGRDVVSSSFIPKVFGSASGVVDCPLPLLGTDPNPDTSATISVNTRSRARFDTSRVTVNVVDAQEL